MLPRTALLLAILPCLCRAALAGEPKRDCYGDPLPEGAIARLSSLCLRNEELILNAAFTADGKTLVVVGRNSISFWDAATGKLARRVNRKNAAHPMWRRCLSADGKTLIQASSDKSNVLHVVDAASGVEQGTLNRAQGGSIETLDVSRDGKILVVVYRDAIALFDVPRAKILHEFKGPPTGPHVPLRDVAALTPDGKQLVLPHADGSLHLVDVASGKELRALEMPPLPRKDFPPCARIQRLIVSPDSRYLAFRGFGSPLTVCALATGKQVRQLGPPLGDYYYGAAFSPNGRILAVAGYAGIRRFDVSSGKERNELNAPVGTQSPLFSPDGRILLVAGHYTLKLWDTTTESWRFPIVGHEAGIRSMAFFPDDKRIVSADDKNGMRAWDIDSGRTIAQRTANYIESLTVDRDGESVRFAAHDIGDTSAHRWNPRTGRGEARRPLAPGVIGNMLALSPDGRSLAVQVINVGDAQKNRLLSYELRLYDLTTNRFTKLPGLPPPGEVSQMLFAPESCRLAARSPDGTMRLWDRDTGKLVRELKSEKPTTPPVHWTLALAADGRSFLTWTDNLLRIRECTGGAVRLQIPAALPTVVAYAPDGRFIACGTRQDRIRVYSAASGKQLAQWQGEQGIIRALAFSRDGRLLASGGTNGTILIWKVPQDDSVPAVRTAEQAVLLWQALGGGSDAAANRALAGLAAAPALALPLFRERLPAIGKTLDRPQLAKWIAELDDDAFKVRDQATRELALAGEDAAYALRQALREDPSPEVKGRIEDLLSRLKKGGYSQRMRFLRALEVLERIGTAKAKELLRDLAGKSLSDELKAEVQSSLRRIGERP